MFSNIILLLEVKLRVENNVMLTNDSKILEKYTIVV